MKPIPRPPLSYRLSHKVLGPVLNRLHMSCGHFSVLCLQSMDRPLSAGERIRFRMHRMACSLCRKFERQMRSLAVLVKTSVSEQERTSPAPEFLEQVKRELANTPRDGQDHEL